MSERIHRAHSGDMVVLFRTLLSTSSRLFYLITLIVLITILYIIRHMKDGSAVKMHILSNYDQTVSFHKESASAVSILQKQLTGLDELQVTSNPLPTLNDQSESEDNLPQPMNIAAVSESDAAIFYIDPPDKPIKPVKEKRPLVNEHLQQGIQPISKQTNDEQDPNIYSDMDDDIHPNRIIKESSHVLHNQIIASRTDRKAIQIGADDIKNEVQEHKKTEVERLRDELNVMKVKQESLVQEWQKLREEQHKLLEDKIRFKKELSIGHWHTRDPVDLFYRSRLPPTNPAYWDGLNSSVVELRYPGILFSREYKPQPFINPSDELAAGMQSHPTSIQNMTDGQAEDRFYQLLTQTHLDCGDIKRLGNTGDGGWDVCVVEPYFPKPGCIVYSFGINYDFTFDDSVAETFGCEVRTFDPSMLVGDHMHQPTVYFYQLGLGATNTVNDRGWKLETMASIMSKLRHLNKTIDIVKMDIEFSEWACLRTMMKEGVLRNIKQLMMEIHTPEVYTVSRPSDKDDFYMMYNVLYGLERHGFRKFHFTYNPLGKYRSVRTGKSRSCCYELYYLNIRYLGT